MQLLGLPTREADYDQAQTLTVSVLPTGASIVKWNLSTQQNAEITLTQNVTFDAPIGWKKGRLVMLEIIQGGAGSFTAAWNSNFKSVSALTLGTAAGSSNVLVFKCIDGGVLSLVSNSTMTRT